MQSPETKTERKWKATWRAFLGVLSMLIVASSGIAPPLNGVSQPANAATFGPGVWTAEWFMGSYNVSGTNVVVYCLEPGAETPLGAQTPGEADVQTLRGYWTSGKRHFVEPYSDPAGLRQMAYILHNFGAPLHLAADANVRAAATSLAIWIIRSEGDPWLNEHVIRNRRASGATWVALADQMVREAKLNAKPTPAAVDVQAPIITWDGDNRLTGTIDAFAGTTSLQLHGAIVREDPGPGVSLSTDRRTVSITDGQRHSIRWTQRLEMADGSDVGPSVSGTWELVRNGWPAAMTVFAGKSFSGQQQLGMAKPEQTRRSGTWGRAAPAERTFRPTLTTQVDAVRLTPSDAPTDRVTIVAEEGSPWPTYVSGEEQRFREVRATGTLYGPLRSRPHSKLDIDSLPVAAQVTLVADVGPGTYEVQAPAGSASAVGFYSWVWKIAGVDQGSQLQTGDPAAWHLNSEYVFADELGLESETHVQPMRPVPLTELEDETLPIGGSTIASWKIGLLDDAWLGESDGAVPLVIRATMYETSGEVQPRDHAPETAGVLSTDFISVTRPADLDPSSLGLSKPALIRSGQLLSPVLKSAAGRADQSYAAPPVDQARLRIEVPREARGGVTVQACVLQEDQAVEVQPLIFDTCDVWGSPTASARIEVPHATTQAQESVAVGESMRDVAAIHGLLPAGMQTEVTFTAYLQPRAGMPRFDEQWRGGPPGKTWSAAEAASASCESQPVSTTPAVPVERSDAEYHSPPVITRSEGTIFWVESLVAKDDRTGEEILLHRGTCGLENERTVVHPKTKASLAATGGGNRLEQLLWGICVTFGGGATVIACVVRSRRKRSRQ